MGFFVGLRRSHFAGDAKVTRGWVKVMPTLARGRVREYLDSHPGNGQGNGGSAEPMRRYRAVLNTL
jgi:hypothetical protein